MQKKALGDYTTSAILSRKDKIGFGTPGEEWMLSEAWQEMTMKSYANLTERFPEVFKKNGKLPKKGFDRWKVNQLSTWSHIFLN